MEYILHLASLLTTLGAALGGTALGGWLERKASDHARRSMRIERATDARTQPIFDYLHHASVLLGLEPHIADAGGLAALPTPARAVFENSLTSMLEMQGPANVRVAMLDDMELRHRIGHAHDLLGDLLRTIQEEAPSEEMAELWHRCVRAIADAQIRLDRVKEQLIRDKSRDAGG
jgi:hypothetical protein